MSKLIRKFSLQKGTIIPVNIKIDGKDPLALDDKEYPDWLWRINEPPQTKFKPEEMESKKYVRYKRKLAIKEHNYRKSLNNFT